MILLIDALGSINIYHAMVHGCFVVRFLMIMMQTFLIDHQVHYFSFDLNTFNQGEEKKKKKKDLLASNLMYVKRDDRKSSSHFFSIDRFLYARSVHHYHQFKTCFSSTLLLRGWKGWLV